MGFALGLFSILPAQAISLAPNDEIQPFDNFGASVAVDRDTIVVGKNGDNERGISAGAAYIFEPNPAGSVQWVQVAKIFGDSIENFDRFGDSAAIDGDLVAVGATSDDDVANSSGAVYLFERNSGGADQWGQLAKLSASDGGANQRFGSAIDISGDRMVVGAYFESDLTENFGAAYVFERENGQWIEKARLLPANPAPLDNFGKAVAISGEIAVVGADAGDVVSGVVNRAPGVSYVFERNAGGNWGQTARLSVNEESDSFGVAVGISGDILAVGAPGGTDGSLGSTGAVYIFERKAENQWEQTARVVPNGAAEGDAFGNGVAMSGNAFVAGATGSTVNNFLAAGAAYVFERREDGQWSQVAKLQLENPSGQQGFGGRIALGGDKVVGGILDFSDAPSVSATGSGAFAFQVPVSPPPPPPELDIFSGGDDLGGGWYESSWFGFYNTNFDPWIFHAEHSWTFVDSSSSAEGMFLFDLSSSGWFFTGEALYPNLFSFNRNAWVFYFEGTSGPRQYVDLGSGEFFDQQ